MLTGVWGVTPDTSTLYVDFAYIAVITLASRGWQGWHPHAVWWLFGK